jgi:hypothetical protein
VLLPHPSVLQVQCWKNCGGLPLVFSWV